MFVRTPCGVGGGVSLVTSFEATEGRGWCGLAIAETIFIGTEQLEARELLWVPRPAGGVESLTGGVSMQLHSQFDWSVGGGGMQRDDKRSVAIMLAARGMWTHNQNQAVASVGDRHPACCPEERVG